MAMWHLLVLALLAGAFAEESVEARASTSVTPVQKVITLLEDLKTEVQTEGTSEAETYNKFACFCKDTTTAKATSITTGQDNIDEFSATIEEKTATKMTKETELDERKKKQEELSSELAEATAVFAKNQAEYEASSADLNKAISSLESAIDALEKSKPTELLELKDTISRTLVLAQALQIIDEPKSQAVTSFMQAKVDPSDPEYEFHSQHIIDLCEKLLKEFQDKKAELDAEWNKTKTTYEALKADLEADMATNKTAMDQLETDIEGLKSDIADARSSLISAEAMLKDDQIYLKDLTERCEGAAKDWDQRSQMRADELQALTEALAILTDQVKTLDEEVNVRALMQVQSKGKLPEPVAKAAVAVVGKAVSFLQQGPVVHHTSNNSEVKHDTVAKHNAGSFLARSHIGLSQEQRASKAIALLGKEGQRLNSAVLTSLSFKLADDPFLKVKKLIQQLIERLLSEATAEATKKGFCDTEVGKAKKDRDHRWDEAQTLSLELSDLELKEEELEQEIGELTVSINQTTITLAEGTSARAEEKQENLQTLKDAKEGLKAVGDAIVILRKFYKQAAKAGVFLQASPVDEDTEGPGFGGAYQGKQESSGGIIGLLEVIKSDFERTIKTVDEAEKANAADFVKFDRTSKSDIAGKETKKELDEQDLETTKNSIEQKMADLQTAQDLLDKALQELESLKPMCMDTGMSYAERVAKREEEMAALKRALCILDTEGVEPDCEGEA